ncbi:MAG: CDP-alcohol phosphatidyltransferase family protein [Solirubrobacterales bacterium]
MLDATMRTVLAPALDAGARRLDRVHIGPGTVTAAGLVIGIACCVAAALAWWPIALALWLANRVLDGLDGPLARLRGATDLGGMLDFLADFVVYAGFPLGVAIAEADARIAACALLAAYLLNNIALLSHSSLIEKRRLDLGDERSLRFTAGLTEGTETILCYALVCLVPAHAATIFWAFAVMVMITVAQRIRLAVRTL